MGHFGPSSKTQEPEIKQQIQRPETIIFSLTSLR